MNGRDEDGIGGDELKVGTREMCLHRAQRRRHRDAPERVHDLPGFGNGAVIPTGTVGVGLEAGVAEQVAGRDGHGSDPSVRVGAQSRFTAARLFTFDLK